VNAAYKAKAEEMNVNRSVVYQKLNGVEPQVSGALLRETAAELGQLIQQMGGSSPPLLAGYETQRLDGNALAATEHRLNMLQTVAAAPLPGKSLVVLDPASRLAVDIFPCQDGHAQERRLFPQIIDTVQAGQLWIADWNGWANWRRVRCGNSPSRFSRGRARLKRRCPISTWSMNCKAPIRA
jgi:hypothetical protein